MRRMILFSGNGNYVGSHSDRLLNKQSVIICLYHIPPSLGKGVGTLQESYRCNGAVGSVLGHRGSRGKGST